MYKRSLFYRLIGRCTKGQFDSVMLLVPETVVPLKGRSNTGKLVLDEVRFMLTIEYTTPSQELVTE